MNEQEIKVRFAQRIRENYEDFLKDWLSQEPEELVSYAEEIAATKMLSEELPKVAATAEMEYLLHFENPLEVVRDGWMSYNNADISKELKHVVWFTEHNASLWAPYPLSKEHTATQQYAPLTVRDFLERYPGEPIDMMTSNGYVHLTPDTASKLLAGGSVSGNSGWPDIDVEIAAEELLEQTVANINCSGGKWNIVSIGEDEPEQTPTEQGVTMC